MMKRTLSALMLSGALLCALSVPALAAEPAAPQTGTSLTQEETLPDSVLYYGTVTEVVRDEDGTVSRLALSSEPVRRLCDEPLRRCGMGGRREADRLRSLRPGGW